ncbi:MAG: hypothetical protein BGO43_01190 [Gammaproteobacteria bacterium 39-13]|nr:hypothetical protein [Gammaproteobacteria bacterium]OJV92978.1 MAG: hypothetical protein BGO43_01190 [Gammaproteobacteria bacterium 39-13]
MVFGFEFKPRNIALFLGFSFFIGMLGVPSAIGLGSNLLLNMATSFSLAGVLWAIGFYTEKQFHTKHSSKKNTETTKNNTQDTGAKKSSAQTKIVHLCGIYTYIDFSKIDSRITQVGGWMECHPMRTMIKIPTKHHDEIMAKVNKVIDATKPKNTRNLVNNYKHQKDQSSKVQSESISLNPHRSMRRKHKN